jgi:hypothetical protein
LGPDRADVKAKPALRRPAVFFAVRAPWSFLGCGGAPAFGRSYINIINIINIAIGVGSQPCLLSRGCRRSVLAPAFF